MLPIANVMLLIITSTSEKSVMALLLLLCSMISVFCFYLRCCIIVVRSGEREWEWSKSTQKAVSGGTVNYGA